MMPVITGRTGTISVSFRQYLNNVAGKHDMAARNYTKQPHWALHTYCGKC